MTGRTVHGKTRPRSAEAGRRSTEPISSGANWNRSPALLVTFIPFASFPKTSIAKKRLFSSSRPAYLMTTSSHAWRPLLRSMARPFA